VRLFAAPIARTYGAQARFDFPHSHALLSDPCARPCLHVDANRVFVEDMTLHEVRLTRQSTRTLNGVKRNGWGVAPSLLWHDILLTWYTAYSLCIIHNTGRTRLSCGALVCMLGQPRVQGPSG
jgi:hypothetical protein